MNNFAPLTPEQIDLLLSADLDGEFDAAASDLRLESAAARALLESVPDVERRRVELAAARDRLAAPIEIDELLAARLRTKALKAAAEAAETNRLEQRRRRTRRYGLVGGVAAALLVVVALGATLNTTTDSDGASSSADSAAGLAPSVSPTSKAGTAAGDAPENVARSLPLDSAYSSVEALTDDVRERRDEFARSAPAAAQESAGSDSGLSAEPCGAVAKTIDQAAGPAVAAGTTSVAGERLSALLYLSADGRTLYFFDANCRLVNRQLIN